MPIGKHPRATGVAPPIGQRLTAAQRDSLRSWIQRRNLTHVDVEPFVEDVAVAVWLYPSLKALADKCKAGAIRGNLDVALAAGKNFLDALNTLDGHSLFLLSMQAPGRSAKHDVAQILRRLQEIRNRAQDYPTHGARPRPERVQFSSLLLRALRRHTSAKATSTPGGVFEVLLRYAFDLAGEKHKSLHGLAARTLAAKLDITECGGGLTIPSPE